MGIGAWEQLPSPKTGIAIAHTGLVFMEWAVRFANLRMPPGSQIFLNRGFPIHQARNFLVTECRKANMDFLFFLDSDVLPPPETINMLLAADVPIISGVYRSKSSGLPAAWKFRENANGSSERGYVNITKYTDYLNEVDIVGMGCCLINMKVFDNVAFPWFDWTLSLDMKQGLGEDFYFCQKARMAGYKIYLDPRIQCAHEDFSVLMPGSEPRVRCPI